MIAASAVLVSIGLAALIIVQSFNGGRQTWAASLPLYVSFLLLPVLFAVAVLRYRLYDIEVIINRTVVLAIGSAFAGIGYVDARRRGREARWTSRAAGSGCPCWPPHWSRSPSSRCADRSPGWPTGWPSGPEPSPTRPCRTSAAASPRRRPRTRCCLPSRRPPAGRSPLGAPTATLGVSGAPALHSASWGDAAAEGTVPHVVPVQHGGAVLGSIEVHVPRGRPVSDSDERLLTALADQTAVAFRNTALEAELAEHVAELDRTTRELARSRARILEADDAARRALEAAIEREVMPHLVALPEGSDPVPGRCRGRHAPRTASTSWSPARTPPSSPCGS